MAQKLRFLLFVLLLLPFAMYGEGSKQLTPNLSTAALTSTLNDKAGYLAHDANFPSASGVAITSLSFLKPAGFSRNGATYSKDHRLYIRVKAGERLFYGVRRAIHDQTTASQANLTITLRRTNAATGVDDANFTAVSTTLTANTSSTRAMLLNAQAGVIGTPAQAQAGPNRSVNGRSVTNGYNPLSIINNTTTDYDYYVEFTQAGESTWTDDGRRFSVYDLWDFTVIDASGLEKPGRMRSKLWSFSAGGADNVFSKDFEMFPLIPSTDQLGMFFVKKFSLAGIAPQNFFRFVTNSGGTNSGTSTETNRRSQTTQSDYPEYFNFVNDPDPEIWPSATAPSFSVNLASSCNSTTNGGKTIFTLNTSERSTFVVLINLNGVAGYQPGTADVLIESAGSAGNRTVEWNGLNGLGQVVAKNTTLTYLFRNGSAPVHFPVWDAEANVSGFRVKDIRPVPPGTSADQTVYDGLLFWDDSNLSTSLFPAPQTELFGVTSGTGAHKWGSPTSAAGDLKTVNTWTYGYTNSSSTSSTFNYDCSADVAVTNTASAAPHAVGKEFTYTVTVTNNGPLPATNVVVTDQLDATKLQFVSASDAAYNSSTGTWTVGTMAVGTSRTLTITARPLVVGSISATASQTHTEADNVASNNSATATITSQAAADIAVTNTVNKTSFYNGETVTYTLTARNIGPNAATGVSITDKLPGGLVLEGTVPVGYDASSGIWTVGALGVNETKTITLTARTSQLGNITTTASLNSRTSELDLNENNNTASNTITVTPAADVAVTNVVSSATPAQGETVTYTIRAINNGPNSATNVSLANQIPAGLTIVSGSVSASSGTFNASTGTWTVGTIVTGGSQTLTFNAIPSSTGSLTVTSTQTHTETDTQSSNNTASSTITVRPTADVAVTNVVTSPAKVTYNNGDPITYTVIVTNNGPSPATNVVVTDKLPSTLTFASATPSTGIYSATSGQWTVGTLASGASATLVLNATVNQSAIITTTATQTHTEYDNVNGNNSASNTIKSGDGVVTADIQVAVSKTDGPYYTGKELTLTAKVTNAGPDAATGLSLDALVPSGFTLVSATPKIGTYTSSTGVWTVGNLASGAFTELLLKVVPQADNTVTGDKNYTFTATKKTATEGDNVAANNTASTTLTVQKAADASVAVAVTGDVNGVYYKGITEATFTLTVTNNGADKITNLVGFDTRTGTINFTYTEPGKGYDPATGKWTIPSLNPGQSVTLIVKGIPNTTGRLNLGGSITSADQTDLNSENNKALAFINVVPVADLQVTNTAAAGPYYNNQNTTFTVTVKNNSTDAATGVTIGDVLPAGLTLVSAAPTAGSYNATTGIWTLGSDVLPHATESLVLTVKPTSGTTYSTTASVKTTNEYDSNPANNSATAQITVQKSADVALSSTIVEGPYYVGGHYLVTISASNFGPDPATGVVVSARIASGLKTVAGSGVTTQGTINPATGTWTIGTIGVNETKTLTFLVEPLGTGTLNSRGFISAQNEYDPNGGTTQNGNNSTLVSFTVVDREATYEVHANNRYFFFLNNREHIATATDPDGAITSARIVSGTLPAGLVLESNGELEVVDKLAIRPGTYTLEIETTDINGDTTQHTVTFTFTNDMDGDGVNDFSDIDDNNDGITDLIACGGADPFADHDNDGQMNYYDQDFVHPVYGAFKDVNLDGINDWFDNDLDGILNNLDLDMDGDGITNVVEANGGSTTVNGYDPQTGRMTGSVNQYGLPILAQGTDATTSKFEMPDTDKDGIRDFLDLDSDNDGILDNVEAQATTPFVIRTGLDSDFDGIDNAYDPTCGCGSNGKALTPVNTDNTDKPDYLDTNSDNDQYEDFVEALDDDQDGITLGDYKTRAAAFEAKTGKGYYTTEDSNKNGIPNWLERSNGTFAFLLPGSKYYYDTDQDGLVDLFDSENGGSSVNQLLVLKPGTTDSYEYAARINDLVVPLPVTLTNFTAKAQKTGVSLNWTTAAEKDNDYFQVERSTDGKNFNSIGKVKGNGNSNVLQHYSFQDVATPAGTLYYRLKQVDFDGKFEYSKTIAVQTKASTAVTVSLKAYPNPTTDVVNLDLTSLPSSKLTIGVYALDGRLVKTQEAEGGLVQTLDLTKLAAGTYLVQINSTAVDTVIRVVKQ